MQPGYESHRHHGLEGSLADACADQLHGLAAWAVRGTGYIPDLLFSGRSPPVYAEAKLHSAPGNVIVRAFLNDTGSFPRRLLHAALFLIRETNGAV